jgi:hypothetical protein
MNFKKLKKILEFFGGEAHKKSLKMPMECTKIKNFKTFFGQISKKKCHLNMLKEF